MSAENSCDKLITLTLNLKLIAWTRNWYSINGKEWPKDPKNNL